MSTASTYSVATGEGLSCRMALTREQAMRIAREQANERGEAMVVIDTAQGEDAAEIVVEPRDTHSSEGYKTSWPSRRNAAKRRNAGAPPAVMKVLRQIDSGAGPGGSDSEAFTTAKRAGLIRRDVNGNTVVTKKGLTILGAKKRNSGIPTEKEYEAQESRMVDAQIAATRRASKADREAGRAEMLSTMRNDPDHAASLVDMIVAGNYGKGPYDRAQRILAQRGNKPAQLMQLVAVLEYNIPPEDAPALYRKLSAVEKKKLDAAVASALP